MNLISDRLNYYTNTQKALALATLSLMTHRSHTLEGLANRLHRIRDLEVSDDLLAACGLKSDILSELWADVRKAISTDTHARVAYKLKKFSCVYAGGVLKSSVEHPLFVINQDSKSIKALPEVLDALEGREGTRTSRNSSDRLLLAVSLAKKLRDMGESYTTQEVIMMIREDVTLCHRYGACGLILSTAGVAAFLSQSDKFVAEGRPVRWSSPIQRGRRRRLNVETQDAQPSCRPTVPPPAPKAVSPDLDLWWDVISDDLKREALQKLPQQERDALFRSKYLNR